jgi:hypothetical protein
LREHPQTDLFSFAYAIIKIFVRRPKVASITPDKRF